MYLKIFVSGEYTLLAVFAHPIETITIQSNGLDASLGYPKETRKRSAQKGMRLIYL